MKTIGNWAVNWTKFGKSAPLEIVDEIKGDMAVITEEFGHIWEAFKQKADRSFVEQKADVVRVEGLAAEQRASHTEITKQLAALAQHLESGLPDELKRLFDQHLGEIDKANETKLAEMRSVAERTDAHQSRALQAEQTATETGRNCEVIREELKALAALLRDSATRAESEMANHVATARAEAETAKASSEAANKLHEQHHQATATFWGRLRWLLCGPAS